MIQTTSDKKNISFSTGTLESLQKIIFQENVVLPKLKPAIFVHPPKTAGTNLVSLAEAVSKVDPNFQCKRFAVPRKDGISPNRITETWIGGLETAKEVLEKSPLQCQNIQFISGHFPFGLHHLLPQPNQAHYLCLLRDPVEREISAANFDYQRGYVTQEAVHYYLKTGLDNPQVRMLAGERFMQGPCTEETYNEALRNLLQHEVLTGVTEDATYFFEVVASLMGWPAMALSHLQVTGTKAIDVISDELRQQLETRHAWDAKLYHHAKAQWQNWKETHIQERQPHKVDKVLCLPPEFTSTKTPCRMTYAEIEAHNKSCASSPLVEVKQQHSGVPDEAPKRIPFAALVREPQAGHEQATASTLSTAL